MRAIRTGRPSSFRGARKSTPSQVGSSEGEVRVLSGALRESPGAAGEDSHRCRKACGGRRSMERWLGTREPAERNPPDTDTDDWEGTGDLWNVMDQHVHAVRGRLTGRTPGSEPGNGTWVRLPPPEPFDQIGGVVAERRGDSLQRCLTAVRIRPTPSRADVLGVVAETVQAPG